MTGEIVIALLAATVQSGTPILFATLGEIFTEKSGVLNLGVEGVMILGALAGFVVARQTGSPTLGFIAAGLVGSMATAIHGAVCLWFQGNQVVSGLALTILGAGLANYLGTAFIGMAAPGFAPAALPLLADIPWLGPIFFQQDPLVYVSYLIPPVMWLFFARTRFGLGLRAAGEYPAAATAAGLNVAAYRWLGVVRRRLFHGTRRGLSVACLYPSVDHQSHRRTRLDCRGPGDFRLLAAGPGGLRRLSVRRHHGPAAAPPGLGHPAAFVDPADAALYPDYSRPGAVVMAEKVERRAGIPGGKHRTGRLTWRLGSPRRGLHQ
jgi:ABC-type uncharacterized transport system permease subunit